MALNTNDQMRIREYLLGHLSEEEQEKVEERLMVDDDLFEELEVSKGELIEEYCAGELRRTDRDWFERHYLASPEGRQRYALAVAIGNLPSPKRAGESPTFFERLTTLFRNPRLAVATVVFLLLVSFAALAWRSLLHRPETYVSVVLANSVLSRGNGENMLPSKVKLPFDATDLKASLILPKPFPQDTRFQAVLDNQVDRKPVKVIDHKDNMVTVLIPTSELPPGKYSLELTAFTVDGIEEPIPGSYRFDIN